MNKQKGYQTLVADHKELLQFGRKLGSAGGIMQFSILIFVTAWKYLEIPYFKVAAPILFAWCLYQFAKDFFTFLKVDRYRAQIISDGILLEKKGISSGKFFHEVLEDFNLMKILSQRSLVNLLAFGCLGYFFSQFITELNPKLIMSYGPLIFISMTLTTVICRLYYNSLKSIVEIRLLKIKDAGK